MSRPAVFLDRDGVINRNRAEHVRSVAEFEPLPGAAQSVARLSRAGWPVVVVTNQSVIGRGLASRHTVEAIHRRMIDDLGAAGGTVAGVFYCPHRPDEGCACRKPRPGLLRAAAEGLDLDLERSYLVGDAASDVEAAWEVGCSPILVETGRGRAQRAQLESRPGRTVHIAGDLATAVDWILSETRSQASS